MRNEYRVNLKLLVYNKDRANHLRGEKTTVLPFVPSVGMHIQYKNMYPLQVKKVVWLTEQGCFDCIVEDENSVFEFRLFDDLEELAIYDTLHLAKKYGWLGLDKIYEG